MNRIFVVGCPRSGTTLVHSLLGAHPQAFTLLETFFFARVVPRERIARRIGLASSRAPHAWARLADAGIVPPARAPRVTARQHGRALTQVLDDAARAAGASAWVEKTPVHLHYVREIERAVPDATFIHVVRSGPDVVASLHAVTTAHPDAWGGPRSVTACARRWADDVARSAACLGRPGHAFVSYERLTTDPVAVVRGLCAFAGLDDDDASVEAVLAGYRDVGVQVGRGAPWKTAVTATIGIRPPTTPAARAAPVEGLLADATRLRDGLPFL